MVIGSEWEMTVAFLSVCLWCICSCWEGGGVCVHIPGKCKDKVSLKIHLASHMQTEWQQTNKCTPVSNSCFFSFDLPCVPGVRPYRTMWQKVLCHDLYLVTSGNITSLPKTFVERQPQRQETHLKWVSSLIYGKRIYSKTPTKIGEKGEAKDIAKNPYKAFLKLPRVAQQSTSTN